MELKEGKRSQAVSSMLKHPTYKNMMSELELLLAEGAKENHPKLLKLRDVVDEHFRRKQLGEHDGGGGGGTKAIIFTQFRQSVKEIMQFMQRLEPLVRCAEFVGQSSSSNASRSKSTGAVEKTVAKGMNQKEQKAVVAAFTSGQYNVLVATSIGEEGLDIGEVDLIVQFDAVASPIRMVQRMGRTGRKRNGKVLVLVSEGQV
jgi:ATP-dependent DNA helicase MPH1